MDKYALDLLVHIMGVLRTPFSGFDSILGFRVAIGLFLDINIRRLKFNTTNGLVILERRIHAK